MSTQSVPENELEIRYVRSSGPGGQNVNKVNSKVLLEWGLRTAQWVPEDVKQRFSQRYPGKMTLEGYVILTCDETRDQKTNLRIAKNRLDDMLRSVWEPPKPRKATKPTRGSQERRMSEKKRRSEVKKGRKFFND